MATVNSQVYQCDACGNMVEVVRAGTGQLVCCGEPMKLLQENTTDAAQEKHVPVVEKVNGKIHVKVGSVAHPMEEKHFIEWIELIDGAKTCRRYLTPGDAPEADFAPESDQYTVRAFCNLHGLWKAL